MPGQSNVVDIVEAAVVLIVEDVVAVQELKQPPHWYGSESLLDIHPGARRMRLRTTGTGRDSHERSSRRPRKEGPP
jgi:hypothetical protein